MFLLPRQCVCWSLSNPRGISNRVDFGFVYYSSQYSIQAVCESNPDIHLNKVYKNRVTPSTIAKPKLDLSPQPPPSLAVGATAKLLSVEKGPCEYCHEVIPLSQLINHEVLLSFRITL